MRVGELLDDKYVLERVLGQGGMGVVWAARDKTTGDRVAVKLLLDDGLSENTPAHVALRKELRQRLRREAEACMKLGHHPNVVRVFDWSEKDSDQSRPYIVMELLEGGSLQDHLKGKRILEPKLAARICADVASCLTAAHGAKLVHRDLKPANIYLCREPGMAEDSFVTKVLDFGVCKDGDSVEIASENARTMTGMVLGSIAYMSPQQAMGSKNVDFRTDIWSIGVVLYELLTGLRAFSGSVNDIVALYAPMLMGKNSTPPVPAPSSKTRNIPPELDLIVERCTKPKPQDRYASAEDLARDLYAAAGLPMPVIPPAKSSAGGKSRSMGRALIDIYEPAIIESKAVLSPEDEPHFNQNTTSFPLQRHSGQPTNGTLLVDLASPKPAPELLGGQINVSVAVDASDTDATLRMPPKNRSKSLPRPPSLNDRSADAGVHTQMMAPDAPIASPAPDLREMEIELEKHRKSSLKIPIPDLSDFDAAGGTQMLQTPDIPAPKRSEPSATTSVSMTQTMPYPNPRSTSPEAASTTGRRRRKNHGLLALIGVAVAATLGLVIFVVLRQPGITKAAPPPPQQAPSAAPSASTSLNNIEPLPTTPIAPSANVPTEASADAVPKTTPTTEPNKPEEPAAATSASAQPTTPLPSATTPKPKLTGTLPTKSTPKPAPKCTGTGIFKRCK